MSSWKIILAALVIFGTGVFTGGLLVGHADHLRWKNSHHAETPTTNSTSNSISSGTNQPMRRLPEILSKQFLQRLDEELHLSPEQREAIQKIITDSQNLMRKNIQDARLEIREQLTPDQRTQFDEMVKRPSRKSNSTNAPPNVAPMTNSPAAALVKPCV